MPPFKKLRRVSREISREVTIIDHLKSSDHRSEIIPTRADHLRNMNHEEADVAERKQKMLDAGGSVSAEHGGQPSELHRFPDGEAGEQRSESHDDDAGVRDLLRAIEFL